MIEPLKDDLVRLLLEGIRFDRLGESESIGGGITSLYQADADIKGVISSFVSVEDYKKKGNLDVSSSSRLLYYCLLYTSDAADE